MGNTIMTRSHWMGLTRVLLSPVACAVLIHSPGSRLVLFSLILLAIATDILDGYWARMFDTVSTFGTYLDVVADKIFMCPLLFLLARADILLTWCAVLVLSREFLIMGLRTFAASQGVVIPAQKYGKLKTIILFPSLLGMALDQPVGRYLFIIGTLAAIYSCCVYVKNSWGLLHSELFAKDESFLSA